MLKPRYEHEEVEKGKYENWKQSGYFQAGDLNKVPFSMVIPPPNVTGKLHLGHAFDTTIQDIISRYKRAKGFDVLWVPGTDHAGIATQAKVEQKLKEQGISKYDLGRDKFLEECWKWKNEYSSYIHMQWAKMGLSVDYSRERFTLDEGLNKAVNHVFKVLYDQGLIYQGERIINYDPVLKTALSNIEVIRKDVKGKFYYFKYKVVGSDDTLIVATTRPETMFGDVCLNVNPNDQRYIKYIGKKAINPANNQELPIIADDYVDIKFGTGVMKCTPAHDPNDFIIGKKYNLPHPRVMNNDGTMNEFCGIYNGMDRFECREKLVENIKKDGNLVKIEEITHNVGHSERSGSIVEPFLSKQWFVKMKPLAEESIKLQESSEMVKFLPKRFNKVFLQWMSNIEDWCISRQLWWGHRIPVYYNKVTGEQKCLETPPTDMENYYQDEDVLDTWFSSGLWPFSSLGWPEKTADFQRYYPTNVLVTGYDIIFFWVSRMINQGLHFTNSKPFEYAIIHGLIRDSHGKKMSKSSGNGVDPLDIINTYGVDALRYYIASFSSPGLDVKYSEEKINTSANFLNKIWNSARFTMMTLEEKYIKLNEKEIKLSLSDKYILSKYEETVKKVTNYMDKYELGKASTTLYDFVYDDFCSYYIELAKVHLKGNDIERGTTQFVLLKVLKGIVLMIYPYSPFIAEEIYLSLPSHLDSIMLDSYPTFEKKLIFKNERVLLENLKETIKEIRSYKAEKKMAPNAKIILNIKSSLKMSEELIVLLSKFSYADKISINDPLENQTFTPIINSLYEIDIVDTIDKSAILESLLKEKAFEISEIERGTKMLSNESFIAKAPKEKIEIEQKKLEKHKTTLSLIEEKINKLN